MTCVSHFASTNAIFGLKCNLASCEDQNLNSRSLVFSKEESSAMRGKRGKKREKRKERKDKDGKKMCEARWSKVRCDFLLLQAFQVRSK